MSKFLDRLNQGKDEKNAASNKLVASNAKAQTEQEVSRLTAKAATLEAAYEAAFSDGNFQINRVFGLVKEIEENKNNLALAKKILSEEFAD